MITGAFGVHTPRELLVRAQYEVRELEEATKLFYIFEEEGKHKIGSLAGTCAGTLWNLVDWLANSTDPATKAALAKAGLMNKEAIRDEVKANSAPLTLCWEVTNGYKHCEVTGMTLKLSQIDKALLSAPPLRPDQPLAYQFVPKIKTKAGANLPAVQVYKDALAYWDAFFTKLGFNASMTPAND